MWAELDAVGRAPSGGYRRFAWTPIDRSLREWFAGAAQLRGLDVVVDRAGNQWAWWGEPDAATAAGRPGIVTGSHLDSVPDGGAFDGPLGVVSALAAIDALRQDGFTPDRPIGVVNFADEEGARFGVACAGSRLLTGVLDPDRARGLTDADGIRLGTAAAEAGLAVEHWGRDDETLRRVGGFVELHVEQGRGLIDLGAPLAVASKTWAHGRWRVDLPGEANHAGTTRLLDRRDPMLGYARLVLAARESAQRNDAVATCGKVRVHPNGVNAIPSLVTGWFDARGADPNGVLAVVAELRALAQVEGATMTEESWTAETAFDSHLRARVLDALNECDPPAGLVASEDGAPVTDRVPVLATGAGHDAGILGAAGIPTAMIFVRNPTGISHSPAEFAEREDCLIGVRGLAAVLRSLTG